MADFAPPPGPPPPKVPEGWKAVWNAEYKEWYYVNTVTKQSQWDKPTEPVYGSSGGPPPGAPPGYDHSASRATGPEKGGSYQDNNPYHQPAGQSSMSEDERLARQLQEQENARSGSRGANESFYNQEPQQSPYGQQSPSPYGQSGQLPPREEKSKGLFGKLTSKLGGGGSSRPQQYGQQGYGGGYPQQQYGGYPPRQQYGGGYGGGYPPQQYGGGYGQQPQKSGGLGAAGGAALGLGGGLIGGALLMDAIDDHDQNEYDQGYDAGQDNNGGGDDYGGGDDGGGDF